MADIVVETGSVIDGANSYANLDTLEKYHEARGNTDWTDADEDVRSSALLRAMDYIESLSWEGNPSSGSVGASGYQPLNWPRSGVVVQGAEWPDDEIPPQLVKALAEAALAELRDPDCLAPEMEHGGMVESFTLENVFTTEYSSGAPAGTTFMKIMQHLKGFVRGDSTSSGISTSKIVRA